jgi:hypothetical protein
MFHMVSFFIKFVKNHLMQTAIIEIDSSSNLNLLIELAKKLGMKVQLVSEYQLSELETSIVEESQKQFQNGETYSHEDVIKENDNLY